VEPVGWGGFQVWCDVRCGICKSSNKGFGSLGICSGINSLLPCSVCMYSCSVGSRRVCLSIFFSSVIVSSMFPYSCLLLSMCRAYADLGSLFFIYLVCSWCLALRFLLVCPTYAFLQVLQVNLHIPLFSYSDVGFCLCVLMIFCVVSAVLKAIFMFVFLNRLVTALIFGLWYVNVVQISFSFL